MTRHVLTFCLSALLICGCSKNEDTFNCGSPVSYQGYNYETILIGNTCWFTENLRNANYNNGDVIPSNLSQAEWTEMEIVGYDTIWIAPPDIYTVVPLVGLVIEDASTIYGEADSECSESSPDGDACDSNWSLAMYGRLYNWYVVTDPRGVCPTGWHVATDEEWKAMEVSLGMSVPASNDVGYRGFDQGKQLKAEFGWSDGGNGSNSLGFSGLPGGCRQVSGDFTGGGELGGWWSPSFDVDAALSRNISSNEQRIFRGSYSSWSGLSIRCTR